MSKYGNRKTVLDGLVFDSKHEAERWVELKLLERAGEIRDLERQVPFELIPSQKDEHGRVVERSVKYVADFVYIADEHHGWKKVVEDAKGVKTDVYRIKKKLMLQKYGIIVKEV